MRECTRKALALLMVVAMVLSLVPAVYAAPEDGILQVPFTKVEDTQGQELREPMEMTTLEAPYDANETVRVSIVLEEPSTLERGYATAGIASNGSATAYRSGLQQGQETMAQTISRQALSGEKLDVVWNLTLAANLISANVAYGNIEAIQAVPGVKEVILETRYEPAVYATGEADPNMATSGEMTGASAAYAAGYNGAGMRIAVIDTGTDTDHKSFDAAAFDYAIAEDQKASGEAYDLLDAGEIGQVLTQLNAYKRTLQNGKPTAATPTAERLYGTTKLPFNYNYVDGNFDVTHDNDEEGEHGSHVAGIATANRYVKTETGFASALEEVKVQGVAPDAQLITMKVFGKNGGAYDSDYMAAIEDAILLGCDAVNLSLGSSNPGNTYSETYQDFLEQLEDTDTVVVVAAGNAGTWADGTWNGHLYSDSVSLDMVGSPGSYTNSFTVASADNVGYTGQYLSVGGRQIFYTETKSGAAAIATLAGQELEYVFTDGVGNPEDWEGIDLTDKVAVCARGEINFSQKAQTAADAGAAAILIYNNQAGVINMDLSDYTGSAPCVSITQADGAWMKEQAEAVEKEDGETWYYTGSLTVADGVSSVVYDTPITMSDFSSWGVPGSLELKPEITAPGGNIYSVNGVIPGGESYETMSGTSMASPQIAGMSTLVAQYIKDAGLQEKTGLSTRVLAQSLLMSTAEPLMDAESGSYYPAIQQGAGLANVGDAISASAYVLVDGQPDGKVKAELGDDPERTGKYQFSFTLNNLTSEVQEYLLSADLFTQDLFESYASENDQWIAEYYDDIEYRTAWYLSKTTTALDADIAWTVDGKAMELDNGLVHMDFDGNGIVNRDDAQALLDYASGNREEISALSYADLDGSGDVTTYDAYLLLKGLNGGAVTLPAGGKTEITVTMTLTEAQKKALDEKYENGAYVQGYVFAAPTTTSEGIQGVTHSIPVLAFYGNWTDASMFEKGNSFTYSKDLEEQTPYMGNTYVNYISGVSEGDGQQYEWGANPLSSLQSQEDYLPERAALNNQNGDALCQYYISPIRNAARARVRITDAETGAIYREREVGPIDSGFYYEAAESWVQSEQTLNLAWAGTDMQGDPLPEGTKAVISVSLAPEYYVSNGQEVDWDALGAGATLTTLATIDNTAPKITGISVDPIAKEITISAIDNQFVSQVRVIDPIEAWRYRRETPNQKNVGEEVRVTLNLSTFNATKLQVDVFDYAANMSSYVINVGELFGFSETLTEFSAFWQNEWLMFDSDPVEDKYGMLFSERSSAVKNIRAAANVDGQVFFVTQDGKLYVQEESFRSDPQYITDLHVTVIDIAYNFKDGYLYGVAESGKLVRVDKLDGTCTEIGSLGIPTGTLACDDQGVFYSLSCDDNNLYRFTLDTVQEPTPVGRPTYTIVNERTGKEETVEPVVNAAQQSLVWDCNDGYLYWTQLDNPDEVWWIDANLLRVATEDADCEFIMEYFSDPVLALFARDLDRSGEADWCAPTDQPSLVKLLEQQLILKVGETGQLTGSVLPWTVTDRSLRWSSSNDTVATVDPEGRVTALAEGTCTITATSEADPQVAASCTVTVEPIGLILKGAVGKESGESQLFTWDVDREETWNAGPALDFTPASAAYVTATNDLYFQENNRSSTMHQVDEDTGKTLTTSGVAKGGLPAWDMAACQYVGEQGDAVSIYGSYIGSPASLAENAQLTSGFDFSGYLVFTTGCSNFVAIASGGYERVTAQEEQEDGSIVETVHDTERFYVLDAAGYIWIVNFETLEDGDYTCYLAGLLPTDLAGKLPFPKEGDLQYCSMVEDQQTGSLVLSYFTGGSSEVYLLYRKAPESLNLTAVYLGSMGSQVYPATLYGVESTGVSSQTQSLWENGTSAEASEFHMEQLPMEQLDLQEKQEIPAGTLNAVTETQTTPEADGKIRVPVEVSAGSHSGLVTVNYDAAALTLEDVTAYGELTSLLQEEGSVTLGFADLEGLATAATLTFAAKEDAPNRTEVTCTYLQQNEKTGTAEKPVETRTKTLELRCPSEAFADLGTNQWYHEGVDYVLEQELMIGMSDTRFAPNGTMTRGQLMTVLYRMAGEPETKGQTSFTDVKADRYYTDAIAWAYEAGIAKGMTPTAFAPNAPVTREQMVTFLARYAQLQGVDTSSSTEPDFTDAGNVSGYAQEAMAWAVETGLVQGMGNGKLDPKGPATRAQMATVLMRFCETILK